METSMNPLTDTYRVYLIDLIDIWTTVNEILISMVDILMNNRSFFHHMVNNFVQNTHPAEVYNNPDDILTYKSLYNTYYPLVVHRITQLNIRRENIVKFHVFDYFIYIETKDTQ